jgi:GAF domain-containing protein
MPVSSAPPEEGLSPLGAAALDISSRTRTFHALAELLAHAASRGANPMLTRNATAAITRALDAERASVWLYDTSRVWCYGADRHHRATKRHEVPEALSAARVAALLAARDRHAFAIPIATREGTVGLLVVERHPTSRAFTLDETCFVRAVADVIALCVEPALRARSGAVSRRSSLPPPA